MVCKSAALEEARGCDYSDGRECPFTSSVGHFRPGLPLSHSAESNVDSVSGPKKTCVWWKSHSTEVVLLESRRKGWVLRDSQSSWKAELPSGKSQDDFCSCQTYPINMEDTDSLHHINRLCCQKFL